MYKTCSNCEINKTIDNFHKLKQGQFGRHSICKLCRAEQNRMKQVRKIIPNYIICKHCNERKLVSNFYKNNKSNTGYQIYCKKCQKQKIAKSKSKLNNYCKIILDKFIRFFKLN